MWEKEDYKIKGYKIYDYSIEFYKLKAYKEAIEYRTKAKERKRKINIILGE